MTNTVTAYTFRDRTFAPSGDTIVCVVDAATSALFMSSAEVADAFSGYALYKRGLLNGYVGVWGRRNSKRLRRFLQERGAEIILHRGMPDDLRLSRWVTHHERKRVRSIPQADANGI
jgi:hypothetical protein